MQACPVCENKTIKNRSKVFLSPAKNIECSGCGAKLTVPKWSVWPNVSYTVLVVMIMLWMTSFMAIPLVVISYCLYIWGTLKYVPFVVIK